MTQPELQKAATINADSSWLWPFAILIVFGILIAAYRYLIIQTVLENGQVVARCRWQLSDLLATEAKSIFCRTSSPSESMNPRVVLLLSQVFNGQEIAFGVLVYCWGVCMVALALMQLGDSPILLSPTHTAVCVALGIVAMLWGIITVVRRKRNNPFAPKDLVL